MFKDCSPVGESGVVVVAGDSVASLAVKAGHVPDTVWLDSANAALKEARSDGEVLLPGDHLTVMPIRLKEVPRVSGARHHFQRKGSLNVTIVAEDDEGSPFAGKKYELDLGGVIQSGTTDDAGKMVFKIAAADGKGTLKLWVEEPGLPDPWIHTVIIGLYPIDHTIGIQQRLFNLGYYAGDLDGELGAGTTAAISLFQADNSIEVTGEPDEATRTKLVEIHRI